MSPRSSSASSKLGFIVVLSSILIGGILWLTAPTPKRRPIEPWRPLVEVEMLTARDHQLRLEAHGRIEPITRVQLVPEVTGRVLGVHPSFLPGGRIAKGETIVRLDARDYLAEARIAQANLKAAEAELRLERGRQRAAVAEWQQFGAEADENNGEEKDLATRGPQLRIREAAVERARTTLTRAQLDVDRCSIRLPYTAVIESVAVTTGSLARSGQAVGVAYPVDVFWVRASLPVEQLRWVDSNGGRTLVFPQGATTPLEGKLREITPKVEERGSLGQVLVEVPLEMTSLGEALPVKAGEFVRVVIPGRRLQNVFVLPRKAFHAEGELWLVKADETLDIRQVKPIYTARDVVIVGEGLSENERLITSQLSQPVHGMSVRIQKNDESPRE